MKKFIITIIIAVLVGAGLGIYSFTKFNEEKDIPVSKVNQQVYAIQIGVFDSIENANLLANNYGGIIILDNNKYRVYLAIVSSSLNKIKSYYDEKKISYYIRNIDVSNEFYNTLIDYETVLNVTSKENYDEIIKKILKEYEKEIV